MAEELSQDTTTSDIFDDVSVSIRVCVGTARPTLQELVALRSEAILNLDRSISDDVELFVGERLVATGVLEESEDKPGQLQVRVSKVGADL